MLGFLLTTLIFIGIVAGLSLMTNVQDVKKNWSQYRCRPDVMLMASFYGYDAVNNLEFCLKNGFDSRAAGAIAPFYTYLASFTATLTSMLSSINSIRMTFATIIGSATTVFQNFSSRIQALFMRIQMTAIRMKFMMGRVFTSMHAVLFMGMSGIKAAQNFSNTPLWQFLDAFCFDPDTSIYVKGVGWVPIKVVKIGDILANGERVTSTFQFHADGQTMVNLKGILVSGNHYLLHNQKWIRADTHPDAKPSDMWMGGTEKPLICLNTDTNSFQIGQYIFRDYDETMSGDRDAMELALHMLNGTKRESKCQDSTMACDPYTRLRLRSGYLIRAKDVELGTELSHGTVAGIVNKLTKSACVYKNEILAAGTTVWDIETLSWRRVSDIVPSFEIEPTIFTSFVVGSAVLETGNGLMFRDYVEVHDPDLEKSYSDKMLNL